MSDTVDSDRVIRLLELQKEQAGVVDDVEFQIMKALFELRGKHRIEDMVEWTGWSRQTIYNKWRKHGFEVK